MNSISKCNSTVRNREQAAIALLLFVPAGMRGINETRYPAYLTQLTQLTREERYQIHARNKAEHNQTDRAMILARDKPTVRRELQRNSGLRGYRPQQAQRLTEERRQTRQPVPSRTVCGVRSNHYFVRIGVTGKLVCGGLLYHHLPCKKQRRKRYGSYNRRDQLIDRSALVNDLPLSMRVPDSVTGNPIPLLGKAINMLSSRSLNANHVIR